MQKFLTILLMILMVVLVACGGGDDEESTDNDAASDGDTPAQVDETSDDGAAEDGASADADADTDAPADETTDDDSEPEASGESETLEFTFTAGEVEYRSNNIYAEELEISLEEEEGGFGPSIDIDFPIINGEVTTTINFADSELAEIGGNFPGVGMGRYAEPMGTVTIDSIGETVSGSFEVSGDYADTFLTVTGTFTDIPMINPQGFSLQSEYNATVRSNNDGVSIELTSDDLELPELPFGVNFRSQDPAEFGQEGPITNALAVIVDGQRYMDANDGQQPPNSVTINISYLPSLEPGEYPLTVCERDTPEDTVCSLIGVTSGTSLFNTDPDDPGTITVESVEPFTAVINANLVSLDPMDMDNSPTAQATITLEGLVPVTFPDLPAEGF